jgi:hypothetical protein
VRTRELRYNEYKTRNIPINKLVFDGLGLSSSRVSSIQIIAPPQTINAVMAFPVIWLFVKTIRLCVITKQHRVIQRFLSVGGGIEAAIEL